MTRWFCFYKLNICALLIEFDAKQTVRMCITIRLGFVKQKQLSAVNLKLINI